MLVMHAVASSHSVCGGKKDVAIEPERTSSKILAVKCDLDGNAAVIAAIDLCPAGEAGN